jgi:hypothetical protein
MAMNRITHNQAHGSATAGSQHASAGPAGVPQGFAVCPPQLMTANPWQQEIYRLAYERALAAIQVPRHHRWLFSVWN